VTSVRVERGVMSIAKMTWDLQAIPNVHGMVGAMYNSSNVG